MTLIAFDEAELVEESENELVMRALLKANDSDADVSITWVQLQGEHRRVRSRSSTRIYFVIHGRGEFELDGQDGTVDALPGDLVVIPSGVSYRLAGPMTYLVINQPAFRPGDDDYAEDQ